ncbi:MAG: potassium transporter TrkG [Lachnospiraceae bacterium]|nr:potassium transporter TrkG [Lachnospiraceae bacterium]
MEEIKEKIRKKFREMSIMKKIFLGYLSTIVLGTILLLLPVSSRAGRVPFSDALFTSTSAACVTGLIRFDTWSTWTLFGQMVLLLLIQVGGVGFMTIAIMIMTMTGKKIGLNSRVMMQNAISAPQLGGITGVVRFILKGTAIVEGAGAVLLAIFYVPRLGPAQGIWYSLFHSVSAFCNAGFDLMGQMEPGSSMITVAGNWYVNLVLMLLIIIGGIGFFVWRDLIEQKFRFKGLRLQSKIALAMSAFLLISGAVTIFLLELGGEVFASMGPGERILVSLFQSVTCRTAGFNTVDYSALTSATHMAMIGLMLIGGSPGSTAGGMKTTTAAVQLLTVVAVFKGRKEVDVFHRSIEDSIVRTAGCVTTMYLFLALVSAYVISAVEGLPIVTALFETASAVATVGVTMGITSGVGMLSKCILMALMIFGRAGSLTILCVFASSTRKPQPKYPAEKVQVG